MTNVRLLALERQLVFLEEMLLVDSMIDEVPRQVLIQLFGPIDEEVRIDLAVREGLLPVIPVNGPAT